VTIGADAPGHGVDEVHQAVVVHVGAHDATGAVEPVGLVLGGLFLSELEDEWVRVVLRPFLGR